MLKVLYIEINLVGIVILFFMLENLLKKRKTQRLYDERLFIGLLVANMITLFFDSGMWIFEAETYPYASFFNLFFATFYFIMNPICCLMWLIYNEYKLNGDTKKLKKHIPYYSIPAAVAIFLCVQSVHQKTIFYIDQQNRYQRGPYFLLVPLLSFSYFLYAVILTIRKGRDKDDLTRRELYFYMILFPLLPSIGAILQSFFFGLSLVWILTALALLMIFINIQNRQIFTDQLTGLYNRRSVDETLESKIQFRDKEQFMFMMIIDIDDFKSINDRLGHCVGDRAIIEVARIIKECCREHNDFPSRFGGDEFLIIGERPYREQIDEFIYQLGNVVEQYNSSKNEDFTLSLSVGYAVFGENNVDTVDAFIHRADQEMYRLKQRKK